ncbi:tetratricopeptide repeat protein [Alphaproteobacteria bacterium]|nr:tetratricopeptide repeat protein [Alphaproteobacteria bacterium]
MNLSNKLNSILKEYSEGNKTSAYNKYKKIYLQSNRDIKLRYNLAVIQQELGLLDEAETNYISLIKHKDEPKYNINLYNLYITKGLYLDALKIIDSVKLKNLSLIKVDQDRAYILYLINNYQDSILQCNKILTADDNNVHALNTLGLCFLKLERHDEANKVLLKAISLDNQNIVILNSLGRLNHELRKSKEAKSFFDKAFTLNPNSFETLNNMAGFYLEEEKYQKAIDFYKKAEKLKPNNPILINNMAKTFMCLNDVGEAEKYCRRAISIDQNNDEFKKILALILLKKYDFKNAWLFFDGRLSLSDFANKNSTLKLVQKKIPNKNISNKNSKILVVREQGIGDELLYGTMYNDLLNDFSDLVIECDERLIPLFKNSFKSHKDKFVKLGTHSFNTKKINSFDYIVYAGSLGRYFRNDLKSFSQKPYIKSIENYEDLELANILNNTQGLKIGISWKSLKNRYSLEKSLSLEDFENIFKIKGSTIFNLQYGDVKEDLKNFTKKQNYKIITLETLDLFNNFSGLANLLKNLDLFFTVSNSTAHLAGALGIKTILIKPANHASFHYWNYEDGKTPWYETINIISKENLKDGRFIDHLLKL